MDTSFTQGPFSRYTGTGTFEHFPNPFLDIASLSMPQNWRSALYWAEYIWSTFGTYAMAMERTCSYFLTEIDILNASEDETNKWKPFLNKKLRGLSVIQEMLRNRCCFHGDTDVVTRYGVVPMRTLAGKTVDVLSQGGVYRPATFQSYGVQPLLEVEFSDGRKVLATPEHQWVVEDRTGQWAKVPTTALRVDHCIELTVAPRPPKNADFRNGVQHGAIFGACAINEPAELVTSHLGAVEPATTQTPQDLMAVAAVRAGQLLAQAEDVRTRALQKLKTANPVLHSLVQWRMTKHQPMYGQCLPDETCSPSYWYGFVCGLLAVDGRTDMYGGAVLARQTPATLAALSRQLPCMGMVAGPVRVRVHGSALCYPHVRFVRAEDLVLPAQRAEFIKQHARTDYGHLVGIRAVRDTYSTDEVFCCVEMATHTMVIGNGVLTGQCYGNSFASVVVPFRRWLHCPQCGTGWPLREVYDSRVFNFSWQIPKFVATCPVCKVGRSYRGAFKLNDRSDDDEDSLRVKIWSPHEIEILHHRLTGDSTYMWRIPEEDKLGIRKGYLFHLERTPEAVLDAVHKNQLFRFNPDAIFHMKEPTLAGHFNRGWGLPRMLCNFRQIWYVQVLRRFNEAIALDYVIPFRILTPAQRPSGGAGGGMAVDPLMVYSGGDFRAQARAMVRARRRDPASIQIFPFPVQFQMFGADANQLAPRDLLDQGMEQLLNDIGTPVELYNGSLQLQTAPVALRLFESTWRHLVFDVNAFLAWLTHQIGQILSWESIDAELKPVTIADDMEKQMMVAQLAMSQQVSGTAMLSGLGLDWKKEQRQIAEEARYQSELQSRTQEEMQQAGFAQQIASGQVPGGGGQGGAPPAPGGGAPGAMGGAGAPPGGAPAGSAAGAMGTSMAGPVSSYLSSTGPNTPQTPQDMMSVADSIAGELLGQPESLKDSELKKLKMANPVLHSIVRGRIDQKRRDVRSDAGNQALGAMQQGGGQAA